MFCECIQAAISKAVYEVIYAEPKISNGVLEGINRMVQSAKSCASGFKTTNNLILIIYLMLGKLQLNLPT